MTSAAVRVVIADDQTLFRSGLARLLAEDGRIDVVGLVADGWAAVQACERLRPDVVLMDVKMPKMDGLEATRRIVSSGTETKVLVLTTFGGDAEATAALQAGASGYLLKDSEPEALVCSVIAVKLGEQVIAAAVAGRVSGLATRKRFLRELDDSLTSRETEILRLVAAGVSNKQIARQLDITDKTVRNHLSHMYEKLHIADRSQALLYAMRKGMVAV